MTRNVSARDLCDQLAFIYVLQLSVNIHESTRGCTNKYMYICIYVFIYIYMPIYYYALHLFIYLFVCLFIYPVIFFYTFHSIHVGGHTLYPSLLFPKQA
jgi:hypothetical protein